MRGDHNQSLNFTGVKYFTERLTLSTLTGKPIRISKIRSTSPTHPGLAPHEISFLRLLEAVTNGSIIELSSTGTALSYKPGLISGSIGGLGSNNGIIRHEVSAACERGLSYFLIPLCMLAPFSKAQVNVLFTGQGVITSATPTGDVSVDTVRAAILPLYSHFGIFNNMDLRVLRRSSPGPDGKGGAGEVQLTLGHQIRLPKTVQILDEGKIKRVRGVVYSTGVAAANNARMIEAARGVLNSFVMDTYINSDVSSAPWVTTGGGGNEVPGTKKRIGVGFGISLVAESNSGSLYSADLASPSSGGQPPEDIGRLCAFQLLDCISMGGCVSNIGAPTVLTLMAMGSEDVGRVLLSREVVASEEIVNLAKDLRAMGASSWGMREEDSGGSENVIVSVVGRGVGNIGRKIA